MGDRAAAAQAEAMRLKNEADVDAAAAERGASKNGPMHDVIVDQFKDREFQPGEGRGAHFEESMVKHEGQYQRDLPDDFCGARVLPSQWRWHPSFRDTANHMYRTSYTDHIMQNEISTKSSHPSGYGGHVPQLRHDVLFGHTEFDWIQQQRKDDPSRETLADFSNQLVGCPISTDNPRGPKKVPTYKAFPPNTGCGNREPWATSGVHAHSYLSSRKDMHFHPSGAMTARRPPPVIHSKGANQKHFHDPTMSKLRCSALVLHESLTGKKVAMDDRRAMIHHEDAMDDPTSFDHCQEVGNTVAAYSLRHSNTFNGGSKEAPVAAPVPEPSKDVTSEWMAATQPPPVVRLPTTAIEADCLAAQTSIMGSFAASPRTPREMLGYDTTSILKSYASTAHVSPHTKTGLRFKNSPRKGVSPRQLYMIGASDASFILNAGEPRHMNGGLPRM